MALSEESKSNEALSPYHKDRLYRGVSFGNPQIIHEIVEDLDEEKLLLAWTLIEVIARLDAATQPRATVSMEWKISTPNLRAISCVGERALAQSPFGALFFLGVITSCRGFNRAKNWMG